MAIKFPSCVCIATVFLSALMPVTAANDNNATTSSNSTEKFVVSKYLGESWQDFQHIAVDTTTGMIFAAGVNKLLQLDGDLNLLETVETGPVYDSVFCPPSGCKEEDQIPLELTNNTNKVLLLYPPQLIAIICGSVHQGSCQMLFLRNITQHIKDIREPIAPNNPSASTVAFIAPGPQSQVLYIGASRSSENSMYRENVPAVASRSLEYHTFLAIAVSDVTTGTRIDVNPLYRSTYPITYVYGFSSGNFSYFLTRQRRTTRTESPFISKLVRVCHKDKTYSSYTEVPLECYNSKGEVQNLVQAAHVGKPGSEHARKLGIQTSDDVLFAAFSPGNSNPTTDAPSKESALCVYSLKEIQELFSQNIRDCFSGIGLWGLDYITPSQQCVKIVSRFDDNGKLWCYDWLYKYFSYKKKYI